MAGAGRPARLALVRPAGHRDYPPGRRGHELSPPGQGGGGMSVCIGVDAGGTKTAVVVAEGEREIARAVGAPGAVREGRALPAASRRYAAVRHALYNDVMLNMHTLVVGEDSAVHEL